MKKYNITLKGTTPLLFNRFIDASIQSKTKKRSGSTKEINIEDKLYRDGNGKICVPSTWIYGCLVESAKSFKIVGKSKATYSKLVGSTVQVFPDMFEVKPQEYEPYTISAVNPMTKGRMMVTRPKLDKWEIAFAIVFNEDDIPVEVMKNIIDNAGNYVGIGDWRPAKKGQFGKFIVEKFEEAE